MVLKAGLLSLKGRSQVHDRLPGLDRHDPAGGEGTTVSDAIDVVDDGLSHVSRPEEVAVHGVDLAPGRYGLGRRREGLPEDLAAVDGAPAQILTLAAKQVLFDFLEGELLDERSEDGARDHHGRIKRCARAP